MTNTAAETCANCGEIIGRLEAPYVWHSEVVCEAFYGSLSRKPEITPRSLHQTFPLRCPRRTATCFGPNMLTICATRGLGFCC